MAECPKCGNEIGRSSSCGCGWRRAEKSFAVESFPLGYQQCEWMAGVVRCRHPGSLSTNTGHGGPYYCRLHFGCADPVFGSQVVDASGDYVHETEGERMEGANAEAREGLRKRGMARTEGESQAQYVNRLRENARSAFKELSRRAA